MTPKRIAILGGGISGLTAAYALARAAAAGAQVQFTLFESSNRLGGILETSRQQGFTVECGPDSWVTEKPWARQLAEELGLGSQVITSNDQFRRTYLLIPDAAARMPHAVTGRALLPMPDGMRMMVPSRWEPVLNSPLFDWNARLAYLREYRHAEELKLSAPQKDESIASFATRHFGPDVTRTLVAPLLAGVFGGDVARLSVQAVMPQFVAMEREYGSLTLALEKRAQHCGTTRQSGIFSSLITGLGCLVDGMADHLPPSSLQLNTTVTGIELQDRQWRVYTSTGQPSTFDAVLLATPAPVQSQLLAPLHLQLSALLTMRASSAIIIALAWQAQQAANIRIPRGFGLLAPGTPTVQTPLMAATFINQKFSYRVPEGGVLLRAFLGGEAADQLMSCEDEALAAIGHQELVRALGQLPAPSFHIVRRLPHSLPQYEVGHRQRIEQAEQYAASMPGLVLLGNSLHGVGLPDLIRNARSAVDHLLSR